MTKDWKKLTSHGAAMSTEDAALLDKLWVPVPERCSDKVKELLPAMHAEIASIVGKEYKISVEWRDN